MNRYLSLGTLDFAEPVADVALPDVHFIPWRVAGATFVEIEILHPSNRQMRLEFSCGPRT